MALRRELLLFEADDGGLDILDLLLEQLHHFAPDEAVFLRDGAPAWPAELERKLQAALLCETPAMAALRAACRHGRARPRAPAPRVEGVELDWRLATELPELVAPGWRDGERWRRLAEDRLAGRALLRLEGFVEPARAARLRAEVEALPHAEKHGFYVSGAGHDVAAGELDEWLAPFRAGPLHTLLGQLLGEALPARIFARSWRLGPGDDIAVHNDGLHYVATFSLGLCPGWTARSGGAIAFGVPVAGGLELTERWLPHLGDLLLFRPTATAWHAVEPVRSGTRVTLTGHYVAPSYPG